MTRLYQFPGPGRGSEPPRDARLGALLRAVFGEPPMAEVDWPALASRIGAAVRAPRAAPWWSHVERWQRRALPLALAAGLVGGLALWQAARSDHQGVAFTAAADLVSAVASGASADEAALTFARSMTSTVDLVAGIPQ